MNEKIEQLAEQCYSPYRENCVDIHMFAKMIIKECIYACSTDRIGRTISAEQLINEHFGIEE